MLKLFPIASFLQSSNHYQQLYEAKNLSINLHGKLKEHAMEYIVVTQSHVHSGDTCDPRCRMVQLGC